MARSQSPNNNNNYTNGYEQYDEQDQIFQKTHYTQDISEQMRVPKRIRATGEFNDDIEHIFGSNGNSNNWYSVNKYDMTVPDRIVVMGQDQHLGTRSAPREIVLDNSILPTDPDHVRVSTPPRVITLSEHHFPSASDDPSPPSPQRYLNDEPEMYNDQSFSFNETKLSHNNQNNANNNYYNNIKANNNLNKTKYMMSYSREATPPLGPTGEHLTPSEEVLNLRRQVAKLNRRVLSIEIDNVQRQQRDKIVYCIGLAYFFIKAFMWLSKN